MKPLLFLLSIVLLCYPGISVAQMTTEGSLPGSTAWYLPTQDGAGELFIFELGADTGLPVVALHGGPGADFTYLLPIANGLDSEFHFVFYDQRGSLRSRVTPDSISMAKHIEDLEQLRRVLEVDRIKLISHSAGTLLAFAYLQAYPDHVANLVLVGALPHKNGKPYFDAEYASLWQGIADTARVFTERQTVLDEIEKAGVDKPHLTPKESAIAASIRQVGAEAFHVERWRETLPMRVNPDAARRTRTSTNFVYDYGPLLSQHRFPVTIINGEYDYTVGPRGSPLWKRLAATTAPRVQVEVIPNASHIVWIDDPATFRRALRQALTP